MFIKLWFEIAAELFYTQYIFVRVIIKLRWTANVLYKCIA